MSFRNSKMLNFSHFKTKEDLKQNINSEGTDDKNKNNDNKKNIELKNYGQIKLMIIEFIASKVFSHLLIYLKLRVVLIPGQQINPILRKILKQKYQK